MYPRRITLRTAITACLVLPFFCQIVLSQKKPSDSSLLAAFEKSIERRAIDEIERPLIDLAIANPKNARALELLARVRLLQGRLAEAKALYKRVLILEPRSVSAKINSARIAHRLGERDEALQLLNGIESASLSPSVQLEMAAALFLVGEPTNALALINSLPINIRNTTALPLLAAIYLESGRRQELRELIPLMKKAAMSDQVVAMQSAEVLQNAGLFNEGAAVLRSAPARARNTVKFLVLLGRLEVSAGHFAQAREHLRRAALLQPGSAEVLSAQALLESSTGKTDEALKLLMRAREIAPNSTTVLSDLVLQAMRGGKPQTAVDAARTLLSMEPENPEFEYLYGAASLQRGDLTSAQATLERLLQKHPRDSRACLALGLTFSAQRNRIEDASKQLRHCIEIDPLNFEARYQLALLYKSQGENKQAIPLMEEVVKQQPNYDLALRDLGALYLETGEDTRARELLERAVSLNQRDADTHFQLIRLYNRIGETVLAKQHLATFQKLRGPWGKTAQ